MEDEDKCDVPVSGAAKFICLRIHHASSVRWKVRLEYLPSGSNDPLSGESISPAWITDQNKKQRQNV